MAKAKPAGYKRISEIIKEPVLFKGGVRWGVFKGLELQKRPADIIQGQIGTCFLLGVRAFERAFGRLWPFKEPL